MQKGVKVNLSLPRTARYTYGKKDTLKISKKSNSFRFWW